MKPIVRWTLWQRRWSIAWWSVGIAAFIGINMIFFPTFRNQAAELQKSFDSIPKSAVQLFGGSTDFFSPVGFLNSQIFFLMLPLLFGIMAIGLGANLLGREEQDGTIDALLVHPVSRSGLLIAKSLAGFISLGIASLFGLIVTLASCWSVNIGVALPSVAATFVTCFMLCACFGAVGFAIAALGKARAAAVGLATLYAFGGYLVSSLAGTVAWLRFPSKFFAFHYYQPEAVLRGTYDWSNAWFFIVVIAACAVVSWLGFRSRDVY